MIMIMKGEGKGEVMGFDLMTRGAEFAFVTYCPLLVKKTGESAAKRAGVACAPNPGTARYSSRQAASRRVSGTMNT